MISKYSTSRIIRRALAFTGQLAFRFSPARRRHVPHLNSMITDPLEQRTLLSSYAIDQLAAFNSSTGANPVSSLIMNASGDLFGTTFGGGASSKGTIFKVAAGSNTITTLASFNGTNGANPYGRLVMDASGNLFGAAYSGGDIAGDPNGKGYGTIFELPNGSNTITALATFNNTNGANPYDGLLMDSSGNLFGTTFGGGNSNSDGTVFELAIGDRTSGTITTLASFAGGAAGANPVGDLYMDANGNLFGTTYNGGDTADDPNGYGLGTIFKLPHGSSTISVVASFNKTNGSKPIAGLTADQNGNLFGVATSGGDTNGDGTVFELTSSSLSSGTPSITLLAAFAGGAGGTSPRGDLVIDANGNLFGTTYNGGAVASDPNGKGFGIVFKVAAGSNAITPLVAFDGAANGSLSWGGLMMDANGHMFGTTIIGGDIAGDPNGQGMGIVFELVPIGPPAKLAFIQPPTFVSAGQTITPPITVAVEDAAGHLVDTDTSSITLAVASPSNATLNGTLTVAAVNGVATFSNLSLPAAGSYTLLATDAALTSATSSQFTVTNALFTLNGNGTTIANGENSPSATDSTDFGLAPLNHVNGAITRTYTIQSITNTTLSLSGNPLITGTNAADFTLTTQPTLTIAGKSSTTFTISFSPTIAGTETATVTITSSDSSQSPFTFNIKGQGLTTTTGTDNLQIATLQAGTGNGAVAGQSLNVLYTGSLLNGTVFDASSKHNNTPFALTLGAGSVISGWDEGLVGMKVGESRLLVIPSALGYGASGSGSIPGNATLIFQVQLLSITGPTLGVSGSGHAIASGDTTLTTADGTDFGTVAIGQSSAAHTFNLSNLASAGTLSLTGSTPVQISGPGADQFSITQPTLTSQAGSFNVTYTPTTDEIALATITIASNDPAHPSFTFNISGQTTAMVPHLVFTQQPSNSPTGQTIAPALTITLEDSSGNPITSSNASVTLTLASGPSGAVLNGTTTIALQNGVATFSDLSINAAGIFTLAANGPDLPGAASNSFVVGTMHLAFTQQPTSRSAGLTITPPVTVALEDELEDIITNNDSSVTLAIASGPDGATLGGTTTVAMHNGVATFSDLSITPAGTYTLSASDGNLAGATSGSFAITPLHLAFVQQPANASTGLTMAPVTVALEDNANNVITSQDSSVTLAIASGPNGATLGGTTTVAMHNGVATFSDLSIAALGTYTLSASDGNLTGDTSGSFAITPLHLAFVQQPASALAGHAIAPAITVKLTDDSGNTITGDHSNISLAIATGSGATLGGTVTVAAQNGIATFSNVSIAQAGSYRLTASRGTLSSDSNSASFTISALAASKLAFGQLPTGIAAGSAMSTRVNVTDQYGNPITTNSSTVTLTLYSGPTGKVPFTLQAKAVHGVAIFTKIPAQTVAGAYKFRATAATLTSITSAAFNINAAAPAKLAFARQPATTVAGRPITPAVTVNVLDRYGNIVTTNTSRVTVGMATHPASAVFGGTRAVAAANGVAVFSTLSLNKAGIYTLRAVDGLLTAAVSKSFVITAAPKKVRA